MEKIVLRDYFTNKKLKSLSYDNDVSITYGVETIRGEKRFVIRSYMNGKIIKSCKAPTCSFSYNVE